MVSRLTRKTNGEWDWNSLVGESYSAIVCHTCGALVKETWSKVFGSIAYCFCGDCFTGDKETALRAWIGEQDAVS